MEENNVTVTEMNQDGSVDICEIPAEQFDSAAFIPSEETKNSGSLVTGALTLLGAGAAVYAGCKLIGRASKWIMHKAGYEIVKVEEYEECPPDNGDSGDESDTVEEAEVREFIDKTKKENEKK